MNIFQNVTRGSFVKGFVLLIILACASGVQVTKWGIFGFHLTGIPLWCFGVFAGMGGILFFLWPMIYGSEPETSIGQLSNETERMLFLYLRPFELDARSTLQLTVGASIGILVYIGLIEGIWWIVSFVPLAINISKEQAFKDAFESLGEFIAFGKPRERLRPLGALRVYLDANWKQEVTNYMTQARLVIVRPGKSESMRWEVEQVLRTVPPERILFYLRFRGWKKKREAAYAEFRSQVQKLCPAKLPEQLGKSPYLIFDTSWNSYFVQEANTPAELVRQSISRSRDIITDRLRPVLNSLNIEIPSRPTNLFSNVISALPRLAAFLSAGIFFVAIVVAIFKIVTALVLYLFSLR